MTVLQKLISNDHDTIKFCLLILRNFDDPFHAFKKQVNKSCRYVKKCFCV